MSYRTSYWFSCMLLGMAALCQPFMLHGQRVGVVLSGGGATALAHVGFLRVLEENDIPVDYIGGTSMGAVIAAMYASGYSVAEIDSIVHSEEFILMADGEIGDGYKYYYSQMDPTAEMGTIKYSEGGFITNAIPTNLINPVLLDWKFMESFSGADAASDYKFDQLMIPFRCIAADVASKRKVVFRDGPLSIAVRASITYPFYLPARRVNGALLFDGGIYNNFPADIIYKEFLPDVILGCNVSEDALQPDEDDLISQLQSMILFRDEEQTLCEQMLVVRPSINDIGTFDFDQLDAAVRAGYLSTLSKMSEISQLVERRVTLEEKTAERTAFRAKCPPLQFDEILISGLDRSQRGYVRKLIGGKPGLFTAEDIKVPYFRIFSDDKIHSLYPEAQFKKQQGTYRLLLDVKKEKDLFISFGGNFSSRSINTGFVGLRYNLFGRTAATLEANSYFGRFYGSIHAGLRWDISTRKRMPVAFQASFTQNRWDYYRSLSFFFEDVKPSFILLNERVGTLAFTLPAGNKGKVRADASYAYQFDQYYQTRQFLSVDTADQTDFDAWIFRITWERNTLNRRQYASRGSYVNASLKWVSGIETTLPGSTSAIRDTTRTPHQWLVGRFTWQNHFFKRGPFSMGLLVEGVASDMSFFLNYVSTAIVAPAFQPIPESRTFFMPQFRAHNYVAGGLSLIFELSKNLDLRAEAYGFNAFGRILSGPDQEAVYNYNLQPFFIGSSSLVFHSPIGPVSIAANFYDQKEEPWSVLFNFGYLIFNRSARD
ncbi:MAG: patatin-like phospholipase family protein [Flavobacteriales bacterium]